MYGIISKYGTILTATLQAFVEIAPPEKDHCCQNLLNVFGMCE